MSGFITLAPRLKQAACLKKRGEAAFLYEVNSFNSNQPQKNLNDRAYLSRYFIFFTKRSKKFCSYYDDCRVCAACTECIYCLSLPGSFAEGDGNTKERKELGGGWNQCLWLYPYNTPSNRTTVRKGYRSLDTPGGACLFLLYPCQQKYRLLTVVERRLYNSGHGTTANAFYEFAAG